MNKVILVGRIATNLELQTTKSGIHYLRFTIAVDRKNSNNDITDFIPVVAWRHTASFLANNSLKGSRILVEGSFITNRYVNAEGKNATSYEVSAENVSLLETKAQTDLRRNNTSYQNVNNNSFREEVTFAPASEIPSNNSIKTNEEEVEEEEWDFESFI